MYIGASKFSNSKLEIDLMIGTDGQTIFSYTGWANMSKEPPPGKGENESGQK